MLAEWKILCLRKNFSGCCDSGRSISEAKLHLERALYRPQFFPRPDTVTSWRPDWDVHVLKLFYRVRSSRSFTQFSHRRDQSPAFVRSAQSLHHDGVTELRVRAGTFERVGSGYSPARTVCQSHGVACAAALVKTETAARTVQGLTMTRGLLGSAGGGALWPLFNGIGGNSPRLVGAPFVHVGGGATQLGG